MHQTVFGFIMNGCWSKRGIFPIFSFLLWHFSSLLCFENVNIYCKLSAHHYSVLKEKAYDYMITFQCSLCSRFLTSAWLPAARVLLHLSQRRQGRCQSFPRDVTFSAETRKCSIVKLSIIVSCVTCSPAEAGTYQSRPSCYIWGTGWPLQKRWWHFQLEKKKNKRKHNCVSVYRHSDICPLSCLVAATGFCAMKNNTVQDVWPLACSVGNSGLTVPRVWCFKGLSFHWEPYQLLLSQFSSSHRQRITSILQLILFHSLWHKSIWYRIESL